MNLAIASPSASAYSETFVNMQMERLPCVLRVHGSPVASETIPGGPITPLRNFRGIIDVIVEIGFRGTRWEGPQRRELARRLSRSKVQALLANFGETGVALLPVCLDLGIPLIVHFHGLDAHMDSVVMRSRDGYTMLGRQATAIVAVSDVMVRALKSYGIPGEKIHLIRCGFDSTRFTQRNDDFPNDPLFFGVGRFVDKKAPYLTVLAFKKVYEQFPNAKLVLAGDGLLLETTRNLAATLGIGSSVEFPGVLSPDQVAKAMRRATAFVQHSIVPKVGPSKGDSEGTPVAVFEAMASELPVVSSRHAGIGEVIHDGETGLLFEERDVDGMARAMTLLAQNPSLARTLGKAGRKEALEKYTSERYIASLKQVIASSLQR